MESKINLVEDEDASLNIIVTGCIHGELCKMYQEIENYEKINKIKIDLVLCTGDFESMRTTNDLKYLSCPEKYRIMGDFQHYYTGEYIAPYLTIFIGGNHEASNYLEENYYGGYLAENIFYMGRGNVINIKGIRIAGISGIFKNFDYFRGHFEKNNDIFGEKKSVFHYREFEIAKMSHLKNKIDIFMIHDWPTNIVDKKDMGFISKIKPHFKQELYSGKLGSYIGEFLLKELKPKFFICGHMHFYYRNKIDDTEIYAMDKCIGKKHFFDCIKIKKSMSTIDKNDNNIYLDPEWSAITYAFNDYFPYENIKYSFYNLFETNSKQNYYDYVLKKMNINLSDDMKKNTEFNDKKFKDIEGKINHLLINVFKERKKYIYEKNNQVEHVLSLFNIKKEENKHYLSSSVIKINDQENNDIKLVDDKAEELNNKINNEDEVNLNL